MENIVTSIKERSNEILISPLELFVVSFVKTNKQTNKKTTVVPSKIRGDSQWMPETQIVQKPMLFFPTHTDRWTACTV